MPLNSLAERTNSAGTVTETSTLAFERKNSAILATFAHLSNKSEKAVNLKCHVSSFHVDHCIQSLCVFFVLAFEFYYSCFQQFQSMGGWGVHCIYATVSSVSYRTGRVRLFGMTTNSWLQ